MKSIISQIRAFILLIALCTFNQCTDKLTEIVAEQIKLSATEMEQIQISAARLNTLLSSMAVQVQRKEELKQKLSIKNFLDDYLDTVTDLNEKQFTLELLENKIMKKLIEWLEPSTNPVTRGQEFYSPYDELSVPVKEVADDMQLRINVATEEYVSSTQVFDNEELSNSLKTVIKTIETEIQNSLTLSAEEKQLLLLNTAMQSQSMDTMVVAAKSVFDSIQVNSGGKTAIDWRKIGNIVGSIIVQAVIVALVVAVVVETAGIGRWLAEPLIVGTMTWMTGGVALGAGIGFTVGAVKAAQNKCLISVKEGYGDCNS